jgi:hypothetical protein
MIVSFKRLVLLSAVTVLLGVSLVYALSYSFKPENSVQTLSIAEAVGEQDGLEITMTLEKTEYSIGEPINITLTITNITNQTVDFGLAPSSWDFLVYNNTDDRIFEWLNSGRAFPMWVQNVSLDPRMGLTEVFTWPQTFWISKTTGVSGGQVSPGTYHIVGRYERASASLQTTPMQVTIVKP